jgi:hypothetical protein
LPDYLISKLPPDYFNVGEMMQNNPRWPPTVAARLPACGTLRLGHRGQRCKKKQKVHYWVRNGSTARVSLTAPVRQGSAAQLELGILGNGRGPGPA